MFNSWAQIELVGQQLWKLVAGPGFMLASSLMLVMLIGSWLLLRFTRLGQAHLVTKCAVLSLIAHLLFAVYAWRTYFNLPKEIGRGGTAMAVRLVDHSDADTATETPAELPEWDKFSEPESMPELSDLMRPDVEPELEISRVFEDPEDQQPADFDEQAVFPPLPPLDSLDLKVPELLPAGPRDIASSVAAAEVVEQAAESVPDTAPVAEATPPADPASTPESGPQTPPEQASQEPAASPSELAVEQNAPPMELIPKEPEPSPLVSAESVAATSDAALAALPPPPMVQPTEKMADVGPGNHPLVPLRVPAELASRPLKTVPREFSQRDPQQHAAALAARGGSEQTEQAVTAALAWLASQQRPDGRWDPRMTGGGVERSELGQERRGAGLRSDNGITGLALLAFLGAGHTTEKGEHREVVARGVEYLVRTQTSDGFLGGAALNFERTYCHGMATLALAEALALSSDERLKPAVQRAVAYSVNAQSRQDGGWRYQPGESGDMSQFGWQVLALHSAELGGVFTPEQTREGMRRFLGASTRGNARGLGCYRPGEGVSTTMTAEALLCRHLIEREIDPRTVDEATSYLLQSLPSERAVNEYYWYYGTLAMYHVGGRPWRSWNERLTEVLISRQIVAGADAGAWPADGMWAGYGGKVFSTALSTLCLEVYYRYQPVYEKR
jgi:hypothetical protein